MPLSGRYPAAGLVRLGRWIPAALLGALLLVHPAPARSQTPFTVDGALTFLDQTPPDPNQPNHGAIAYALRGHEFDNPVNRAWWSIGAGGAADTAHPTKHLTQSNGGLFGPSAPDVALTRGGIGMAVWEEDTTATPTCVFNNVPQVTPHIGHIKFARLDARGLPEEAASWSAPADLATGSSYQMYLDPSIALDVNGRGIAVWREVEFSHDANGCVTDDTRTRTRYRVWDGEAWQGPADGTIVPGSELQQNVTASTIRSFATRVRFLSPTTAPGSATRQTAVVVWNDFLRQDEATCPNQQQPTKINEFWPHYAVWNGSSFSSTVEVPGDSGGPPYFQTAQFRADRLGLAADRSGGADLAFQVLRIDDLCSGADPTSEVQIAQFSSGSNWSNPDAIANGHAPDVGEKSDDSGFAVYAASVEAQSETSPGTWGSGTNLDGADADKTAVATLPLDRTLAVWTAKDAGPVKWAEQSGDGAFSGPAQLTADVTNARNPSMSALPVARWGFLYYGAGDNNLGGCNANEVDRMETAGSSADITIVAQVDDNAVPSACPPNATDGTYRAQVVFDSTMGVRRSSQSPFRIQIPGAAHEPNMGSGHTLGDFLVWGKEQYPADRYFASMSDHGDGWRYSMTDDTSGTALDVNALRVGLARGPPLEVLLFDACLMGQLEVAYQVSGTVERMVASEDCQDTVTGAFPYGTVLSGLQGNLGKSGDTLASDMVSAWAAGGLTNPDFTASAFRLGVDFSDLVQAVDRLGSDLRRGIEDVNQRGNPGDNTAEGIRAARGLTKETQACCSAGGLPTTLFVDLFDLTRKLDDQPTVGVAYKAEGTNVRGALGRACIAERHGVSYGLDPSSACLEGRAGGLSVYFPPTQAGPHAAGTDDTFDLGSSRGTQYAADPNAPANHVFPSAAGFMFPALSANGWDEFLFRNYKPVADAGPERIGEVGDTLQLTAAGSSETDPFPAGGLTYAWDFDPGPQPNTPATGTGVVQVPKHVDSTDQQPSFRCATAGSFPVRLVVHDSHEKEAGHTTHFRTDDSWTTVTCVTPQSPPLGGGEALTASIRISGARLPAALRGLGIVVTCSTPCSIDSKGLLARSTAEDLGLARSRKPVRVARGKGRLKAAGKRKVVLKFTRKARRQLKRARRVKLTLRTTVTGATTKDKRVITKKIVLRR